MAGGEDLARLHDEAVQGSPREHKVLAFREVDEAEARRAKEATGIDISGHTHVVDNYELRHIHLRHGDADRELIGICFCAPARTERCAGDSMVRCRSYSQLALARGGGGEWRHALVQTSVGTFGRAQLPYQAIRMNLPASLLACLGQRLMEVLSVHVLEVDVSHRCPRLITPVEP